MTAAGRSGAPSTTVEVTVPDVRTVFVAPDPDPFSPFLCVQLGTAGLEVVVRQLRAAGREPTTLVVHVPEDQLGPTTAAAEAEQALRRLARARIADNRERIAVLRRDGRRSLAYGLVALGVALLLSGVFGSDAAAEALPELVATTLSEGFAIVGWVVLWHPFEALVYDPIALQRENRLLGVLGGLSVQVRALPSPPAAGAAGAP